MAPTTVAPQDLRLTSMGRALLHAEAEDGIAALLEELRETSRCLEALTTPWTPSASGRFDQEGLTRQARNLLRHGEVAKHAAILNALPFHIALLDGLGNVTSVNNAWRQFGAANAYRDHSYGVGLNYLDVCEAAVVDAAACPPGIASCIKSVLAGEAKSYSFEYPCHSPSQQRWFQMLVTPLALDMPRGAIVMHLDITDRKRVEDELHRFELALSSSPDAVYLVERATMSFFHVNDTACRLQNRTREELLALDPWVVLSFARDELERTYDAVIAGGGDAAPTEYCRQASNGRWVWMEMRCHAQLLGSRWVVVTLVRDITARREAEQRVRRLTGVHAAISDINSLIVRAQDRASLFREACRIATRRGGYGMAAFGFVDRDLKRIVPVAMDGPDIVPGTRLEDCWLFRNVAAVGMIAEAIRDAKAVVANVVKTEAPAPAPAGMPESACSLSILPLTVAGEVVGIFALLAGERAHFNEEEMKLLTELADDIGFAIHHIDNQARLEYLAYYDALTGLANRSLFIDRVAQYMRSATTGGHKLALYMVDLERFRNINESLGDAAGDNLLQLVAAWLVANVNDANLLARVGADHFAVVMPEVNHEGDVVRLLEKLMKRFDEHHFMLDGTTLRISAKVGVALFPDDAPDASTLFKNAESALQRAKIGGERYLFYTQKLTATMLGKLTLENQLRHAFEHGEFVLHYQPKVSLETGRVTSAEALIRWNDPRTGIVMPAHFVAVLEETGLIREVGYWALHQAISDHLRWRNTGASAIPIAVNVSPLQLRNRDFLVTLRQALEVDARTASGLEVEITESVIMQDVMHSIATLRTIREMGVRIAIDDFGTGFSSLSYLAKLPVDSLKIDRSFIADMTVGPQGLALVSSIINLAHSLKLNVVAEGVETLEQSRLLRLLNCDEIQGFVVTPALPTAAFEQKFLSGLPLQVARPPPDA